MKNPEQALNYILAGAFVAALLMFAAGYALGRRGGRKGAAFAAGAALALFGLLYVWETKALARGGVSGETATRLTVILPAAFVALPLVSGGASGAARSRVRAWKTALLSLAVALGGAFWIRSVGGTAADAARELGLFESRNYEPDKNKACPEDLKQFYIALEQYQENEDGRLPPAEVWMDALEPRIRQNEWLHCPEVSNRKDNKFGYAMNGGLSGKKWADVRKMKETPLLYDSTDLKKNAHDAVKSLPKPGRHTGRNNILYGDGRVEAVEPK